MSLGLHNLKASSGSTKKKKRVGRGNSSGHGTYSTRGIKGQRSRSGGKGGLKRLGLKQVILATPKRKGFTSNRPKNQTVNLSELNNNFKDGASINPQSLLRAGLIKDATASVKILGNGELKLKKLKFEDVKMSKVVLEKTGKDK
jgi:large subunit ribosomal protein L15